MGLAAPQVGVNLRLMVFNVPGEEKEVVLANPIIVGASQEEEDFEEGCLSFPELYGNVKARNLRDYGFVSIAHSLPHGQQQSASSSPP